MLCGGKCPEEEDVSCTTSNFDKNFKFRSGVKDLLTDEDENDKHVRIRGVQKNLNVKNQFPFQ